ncbi:MAG: hypothetical protein WCA46_14095 [Actinocatenispora sp.]
MTNTKPASNAATIDLALRISRQVPGLALTGIPRRFALCRYDEDDTPSLYLWGAEMPSGAIGFLPGGKPLIESVSAERILDRFGMVYPMDLVWLDDPIAEP